MSELIEHLKGRVVDSPWDNLLAEFSSVVDAIEFAVKIQKELNAKNAQLPDNCRMPFHIGANLGDVVEEADRIYGDGVNIAARLEGPAYKSPPVATQAQAYTSKRDGHGHTVAESIFERNPIGFRGNPLAIKSTFSTINHRLLSEIIGSGCALKALQGKTVLPVGLRKAQHKHTHRLQVTVSRRLPGKPNESTL